MKLHCETGATNLSSMHYHHLANDSDNNHCATGMSFLLKKDILLYKNSILIYELLFLPITRYLLLQISEAAGLSTNYFFQMEQAKERW